MITVRHDNSLEYPSEVPFHPSKLYPEYPFSIVSDSENHVYSEIRNIFLDLGLDQEHYGTNSWNPLGHYVKIGGKIAIKPNWVWDPPYCFEVPESYLATVTHSSVIRAMIDFAYLAVGPEGRISVIDSPIEDANWNRLHTWTGFKEMLNFYRTSTDVPLEILDLRDFRTIQSKRAITIGRYRLGFSFRQDLPGDPRGYVDFDLEEASEFNDFDITEYSQLRSPQKWTGKKVLRYHKPKSHEYSISRTLLEADLIVNLPKLKHHKKAGVTLSLKAFIGATQRKDSLPHFKTGNPPLGDEHPFPRSIRKKFLIELSNFGIAKTFGIAVNPKDSTKKRLPCDSSTSTIDLHDIRVGDWYGAETLWRTIIDLNTLVLCGTTNGEVKETRQRKYLSIIDGIVGGEGQSPLHPTGKKCGLLLAGEDPVALDTIATYLMGFDPQKIPSLKRANVLDGVRGTDVLLTDVSVKIDGTETKLADFHNFLARNPQFVNAFYPSIGWKGHIELDLQSAK